MVGPVVHKLAKIEEQTSNYPQYRWFVECVCGFQSRVGTEEAAKSQFDAHLTYHGGAAYFSNLVDAVEDKEQSSPVGQQGQEDKQMKLAWKPAGVK